MECSHQDPSFNDPIETLAVESSAKPDARVGLVTAVVRTVTVQGSLFMMGAAKGLLKWFFRMPVKLFRPYAVNPYLVVSTMAAQDGKTMSPQYLRQVVKNEGFGVIGRNMAPLLVVNSLIGAFLFNTYAFSTHALESIVGRSAYQNTDTSVTFNWTPFVSGWTAGAAQSLFSTPVDNLQRSLSTDSILAHRHSKGGIASLILANLKDLAKSATTAAIPQKHPETETTAAKKTPFAHYSDKAHHYRTHIHTHLSPYKSLFHNFPQSCLKDSLGFALFFGLFENARDHGKLAVQTIQDYYQPPSKSSLELHPIMKGVTITGPQALAVVAAGGLAGMGFQAVSYPIDRINAEMQGRANHNPKESWTHVVKRMGGIRQVYRGIGAQFVRVVPASAVGLFVFEIVNEYLGP
ncbi:mitochondrial carrier domain-containing protein [Obelidium mucronatum]|nr:mitochondrial carrier domain-containing protein [Obelidium mucronatum]